MLNFSLRRRPESTVAESTVAESTVAETIETESAGTENLPSDPLNPGESGTEESKPNGEIDIVPPDTPPGSDFEVKDPKGDTVLEGKTDENGRVHLELPPGNYTLITFDDNRVPLASMPFEIEDSMTPLAPLPKAGDHSVPMVLLGVPMLIAFSGMSIILVRKKNKK